MDPRYVMYKQSKIRQGLINNVIVKFLENKDFVKFIIKESTGQTYSYIILKEP